MVGADIEDLGEQGRHRVLAIRGKGQWTKASLVPLNAAVERAIAEATAAAPPDRPGEPSGRRSRPV